MKADLGADVRRNPSVCVRYPENRQAPASAPATAVRQSQGIRRLPARRGIKARVASENRSATNRIGQTSARAAFTTTKNAPHLRVFHKLRERLPLGGPRVAPPLPRRSPPRRPCSRRGPLPPCVGSLGGPWEGAAGFAQQQQQDHQDTLEAQVAPFRPEPFLRRVGASSGASAANGDGRDAERQGNIRVGG